MAEGSSGAVWFGAPGFEVLDVVAGGAEFVIEVQTTAAVVGCGQCGVREKSKERRWVTLRDVPVGDAAVRVRWRKRVRVCPDPDCGAKTCTERTDLAAPRRVLSARAQTWAANRVAALEETPASIARGFGVSWSTVWAAVERVGAVRVDDPARVGPVEMVGFDETVIRPAHRRRRRRFITAVVDVATGQILDVVRGPRRSRSAGLDGRHARLTARSDRGGVGRPARGQPQRGHEPAPCHRPARLTLSRASDPDVPGWSRRAPFLGGRSVSEHGPGLVPEPLE